MQYHWAPVRMQEAQALETFDSHPAMLLEQVHSQAHWRSVLETQREVQVVM